jgi:hypothetical protein
METVERCPECGTVWTEGNTCQDHFNQMGVWEIENPEYHRQVHHLMVLCYYLQHPSLYSPEGLGFAKQLLVDFVERGVTPQQVRRRDRGRVDSSKRKFKINGTPERHGAYAHPVAWPMTAANVTGGGPDRYCDSVRAWAQSMLAALRASGNER